MKKSENQSKPSKSYWYLFHHVECPLCWKDYSYKERIYDSPKPKDYWDRHKYEEYYDWCEP